MIKNFLVFTLFLSFVLSSALHARTYISPGYENLIMKYNKLISRNIELRQQGQFLYKYIEPRLKGLPILKVLTGEDIRFVHTYFRENYEHFKESQSFVKSLPISNADNVILKLTKGSTVHKTEFSLLNLFLGLDPNIPVYEINPRDSKGIYLLTALKMSFGMSLAMYDNFLISLSPFYKKGALRRIINNDNIELRGSLDSMVKSFIDGQKNSNFSKHYQFFKLLQKEQVPFIYKQDHELMDRLITSSYSYKNFYSLQGFQSNVTLNYFFNRLTDFLIGSTQTTLSEVSRIFGSVVGNIKIDGVGKMLQLTFEQRQSIISTLQPLDVLVERSTFHLSNLFIPGHFAHVAIWLGNEEELRDMGLWEKLPEIEDRARQYFNYQGPSFRDNIRNGKYIVEALRPGVQMNTFDHFLDIDDMAIFRPNDLTSEDRIFSLERAFDQVGKKYDFNFDVETDSAIVCSELAYIAFEKYPWPTESSFGRYTIEPDHVATLGLNENYFDILMFYKAGKKAGSPRAALHYILDKQKKELLKSEALFRE